MNVIIGLNILVVSFGVLLWLSPDWLRKIAAHLVARADAVDQARTLYPQRIAHWSREFGIEGKPSAIRGGAK